MEKMKNKTFSVDSVCREGYCIIWGVILLLHHTTMPASTMSACREKVQKIQKTKKNVVGGYWLFLFVLNYIYILQTEASMWFFAVYPSENFKKMWVCLLRWEMRDVRFKFQKTLLKWNWIWGRMSASGLRLWRICCWNHWIEN